MPHLLIRPYSEGDFNDYAETLLRTWPCDDVQEARENVTQAVNRIKTDKESEIWVAEADGKAVGFILLEFTKVWGHKGESFEEEAVGINWFDIHPDYQKKRVGRRLLQKAEEMGRQKRLRQLFTHTSVRNLAMVNFASRNGFRFARYLEEFWGKGTGDAFLLVKRL